MTHTEKDDLVERLQSAMCPGSERCNVLTCYPDCECGAMEAAATRITALERELTEAREALKPFADAYVNREKWAEDSYIGGSDLRNRDLRRAARALETTKPRI